MNLEAYKNKVYGMSQYVNGGSRYQDMKEDINDLIAEVERLQSEVKQQQQLCDAWIGVAVDRTAVRCAEIAEKFDDHDPDDDGMVYGSDVAEAIRNAFGLEAPDGKD